MPLGRITSCLLLALVGGVVCMSAEPAQAQLCERMYGYRPRVYGYWPSAYVYPRYGFHHGEIYTQHIGYGEPGFGQQNPDQLNSRPPNPRQPNCRQPNCRQPNSGQPNSGQPAPVCAAGNLPAHPADMPAADVESVSMPPADEP